MNDNNQTLEQTLESQTDKAFSQTDVDRIVQTRVRGLQTELAAAKAAQAPSTSLSASAEAVLAEIAKRDGGGDSTTATLTRLFRGPEARTINNLAIKDPATYRALHAEAQRRGILPK